MTVTSVGSLLVVVVSSHALQQRPLEWERVLKCHQGTVLHRALAVDTHGECAVAVAVAVLAVAEVAAEVVAVVEVAEE